MLRAELRTRLGGLDVEVDFAVPRAARLVLAGPSGAGKTTVLRLLAGLARPRSGRVECGGRTWLDTAAGVFLAPERRRCGLVFQDYALFEHLTAASNIAYGLRPLRREARRARTSELLERFGLGPRADARPRRLSGGERQRVALARALAPRPDALLLDEPLAALDPRTRAAAGRELAALLAEDEVPTVLVTHDFEEASLLGDEVAVMDRGAVVQRGTPAELAARPASVFVADFTGAVVLTGMARQGEHGLTLVELDGGGTATSTDRREGPVGVRVFPWEIELLSPGSGGRGSARNRLDARIASMTRLGNRVRVALEASQPLQAEVTTASAERLGLGQGERVTAAWKAAATRLVSLDR